MLKYSSEILPLYEYIPHGDYYKVSLRENFTEISSSQYSYNEYCIVREFEGLSNEEIDNKISEEFDLYLEFAKLNEETQNIKQEISELKLALSNSDYQIIKCTENFMLGSVLPYDFSQLLAQRTEIRNRINILENNEELTDEDKLQKAKDKKIIEMSAISQTTITNGTDFNGEHYRLNTTDQINLTSMYSLAQAGSSVPYHADNSVCRIYPSEEMIGLVQTCMSYITYHTTYFNLLKHQILNMTSIDEVNAVSYGMTLLPEYQAVIDSVTSSLNQG